MNIYDKKFKILTFLMIIVPMTERTISMRQVHIAAKAAGVALGKEQNS